MRHLSASMDPGPVLLMNKFDGFSSLGFKFFYRGIGSTRFSE